MVRRLVVVMSHLSWEEPTQDSRMNRGLDTTYL
jgi:hypothetical protein